MTEAKIAKLKTKRQTLIAQQQRVKEFVESRLAVASISELETRLQALEKYYSDFQTHQAAIEESDAPDSNGLIRAEFEELYFMLRPTLLTAIGDCKQKSDPDESLNQKGANSGNVLKLPQIPLPTFSGDYTQWTSYYETFSSLVHRNDALDNVTRFHYLRSSLKEGALRRIESIEVTPENYDVALKLLVERYQKRNIIVREHIRQLFNISSISTKLTSSALRDLLDTASIHLRALTSLGRPVAYWDDLIIELILSKLDNVTLDKWNDESPTDRLPTLNELFKFLERRCNHLEERSSVQRPTVSTQPQVAHNKPQKQIRTVPHYSSFAVSENQRPQRICTFCRGTNHIIYRCRQFHALSPKQRFDSINERELCNNCLKPGHSHVCTAEKSAITTRPLCSASTPASHSNTLTTSVTVLLATALIKVLNNWGELILCRALLDSGSQLNFVSERLAVQLGIRRQISHTEISGIGDTTTTIRHSISTIIQSNTSHYAAELNFLVLPRISEHQPEYHFNISDWNIPTEIHLADPAFFKSQKVDMLLGAEIYMDLLIHEQVRLGDKLPILQNTQLGYIVTGRVAEAKKVSFQCCKIGTSSTASLEMLLKRFWEIEAHTTATKPMTAEEKLCEMHFNSTVRRSTKGKFTVRLPFKEPPTSLGDSFTAARRRFFSLERRLVKNPSLQNQYAQFMAEYETLHHMTRLEDANHYMSANEYFLPHHCVIKAESSTTKLRVVFDASTKTTTNTSLNDILMSGPTVQSDLFTVITRFRTYRYVLTADIKQMYRQIDVDQRDRRYQLILWRKNPLSQLGVYQLNTITYGTAAAPYLATRCLTQLAENEKEKFPSASTALLRETYVDDIMTGANTQEQAASLLADLQTLLTSAQFKLHKYCSNNPDLLQSISDQHKEPFLKIGENDVIKTLGLIWHPTADSFAFHFAFERPAATTKRTVLSDLGRIFDPLGLIGPVVVLGKIFMQQLWKLKLSWDQPLPECYEQRWRNYVQQLESLRSVRIPRHVLCNVSKSVQLHSFADSSESAYGACCYLRSVSENNDVTVHLICSKSRVAPTTATTIAKLELQAALLMAELAERILNILPNPVNERFYYTDSKIVLAWIAQPSYTWTTFVANRVAKIQELTRIDEWGYVNTKENPADIISRGAMPEEFINSSLWRNGPEFMHAKITVCPQRPADNVEDIPELRSNKMVFLVAARPEYEDITSAVNHRDSLHRLERIFAYCLRFANNARRSPGSRTKGPITIAEYDAALLLLIRNAQRSHLTAEYKKISKNSNVDKNSRIKSLNPFLDTDGLIRVGGRLQNSNLPYSSKHQLILPKNSILTKILISSYHFMYMHAGPQTLLSMLRQRYWPIDGKHLCRDAVHRCIRCFRTKPTNQNPLMGSLPKERVQPGRAFLTTGIDFCGPVPVHSQIRGRAPVKAYVAMFVCFTTKAIHIEAVSDLSTAAFIAALRRFISRRGLCATIFSDNATNFIGAKNELVELSRLFQDEQHQAEMLEFCQQHRIEWRTIPPRSPHFGGLWEAAVKQAKHHLIRVVANAALSLEELSTITAQIEAILNSRPLMPLSSDPSDLEALTPGHFLIGEPLTAFPEPDLTDVNYNRLARFQRLQQLQQFFWRRWSNDYLHLLQQRHKWATKGATIQPGMLVLVRDDNLPPYKWSLARVLSTIPGRDRVHRVAEVKTQHGVYKRAMVNLYPLPIND